MELWAEEMSLEPSSNMRRFVISPGGREPGPDGDGRCRPTTCEPPIPGDGALRGGVALPKPESVSAFIVRHDKHNSGQYHGTRNETKRRSSGDHQQYV